MALAALVERVWVLSSCYDWTREQIAQALRTFRASAADFADCLIERTATSAVCEQTMTFNTGAAKRAGMTRIT